MNGLLNFLQSASNTAADTVAGPVDLFSFLLNKAGVPVQEPVGGSEWMKRKGLKKDVPQSAASLGGETFGLLSPVAVAAKAPQIAKGLIQAGDNLAAKPTLNPQTGAIVWHGSPHRFVSEPDYPLGRFRADKIGTGEGAQAYGYGHYVAEARKVAEETYAKGLTKNQRGPGAGWGYDGTHVSNLDPVTRRAVTKLDQEMNGLGTRNGWPDIETAKHMAAKKLQAEGATDAAKLVAQIDPAKIGEVTGNLYKVDLPDDAIAKMLDWDKPLREQTKAVQDAILDSNLKGRWVTGAMGERRWLEPFDFNKTGSANLGNLQTLYGEGGLAEETLRKIGIPGIRYLDGNSRGAGSGTSNFVVFPGEEGLLKILERNGMPLP